MLRREGASGIPQPRFFFGSAKLQEKRVVQIITCVRGPFAPFVLFRFRVANNENFAFTDLVENLSQPCLLRVFVFHVASTKDVQVSYFANALFRLLAPCFFLSRAANTKQCDRVTPARLADLQRRGAEIRGRERRGGAAGPAADDRGVQRGYAAREHRHELHPLHRLGGLPLVQALRHAGGAAGEDVPVHGTPEFGLVVGISR